MSYDMISATTQLREILQMSNFVVNSSPQLSSMSAQMNDLNMRSITSMAANLNSNANIRHNLPNNCTIKVDNSSANSLFNILCLKVAIEGRESTNSYFTKIERLVDFNWDLTRNVNLIAVNNRKPLIAYVINRYSKSFQKPSNVSNADNGSNACNQMIRIMNYESRHRCLAKGVFHQPIADLSFAINSISSNSLDILKLAIADRGGNVYVYDLKEDQKGDINANQVLEILNIGKKCDYIRLSWCPYIPSEDDDSEVEGDPGLKLALSCDNTIQLFAIDVLQDLDKDSIAVEVSKLQSCNTSGYQLIENAHDLPVVSLSIAQEVTAICTTGLDDRVRFYKVSLNDSLNSTKMLKQWNLRKEYSYYESDDHISNFFFLDDFDFLLSQTDPTFWGYALFGTRNGDIAIIDLKDWRCRQSIKLISEEPTDVVQEGFTYKLDLSAHFLVAIRGNDAFLLHIRFPHDKEEPFDDCNVESISNADLCFDNSHPYISKVSRFQIYSAPLRSFFVKKALDDNVLIFWITGQSLELCHIDLSAITIEENFQNTYELPSMSNLLVESSSRRSINVSIDETTIASNIGDEEIDLMNGSHINGYEEFDSSLITGIDNKMESQVTAMGTPLQMPIHASHASATEPVSALNLPVIIPIPPPPTTFTQQTTFNQKHQRSESPASKEVQQILSPSLALKSMLSVGTNNTQQLKSDETNFIKSNAEHMSDMFPTKMPNILKDLVKEEQMMQMKNDIYKEIQDSESRIVESIERLDHKMNTRINGNHDQLLNNSRVQTSKIESDIRDMKKELKNACKIRNEEFNKIVEKLVNKVMHEMNVIVQKGFHELMAHVDKELKLVTNSCEKSINAMQTKLSQSIDKTHFQPLNVPMNSTPITPNTPITPQHPYYNQTPRSPTYANQRRTPQAISATQSVPTTPLPFGTPRSSLKTPVSQTEAQTQQSWQQTEQLQQQKQLHLIQQQMQLKQQQQALKNAIIRSVAAGRIEEAITKALNLKDPDLVVQICELYRETPAMLINAIKNDQLVLISLLQQIIYNSSTEETWKTGFIEQIMTNLDLENEFVIKILPGLAPKLVQLLNEIVKVGGAHSEKAKLLAFTFKHLRV